MRPEFKQGLKRIAVFGLRTAAIMGLASLVYMAFFYLVLEGLEGARWG